MSHELIGKNVRVDKRISPRNQQAMGEIIDMYRACFVIELEIGFNWDYSPLEEAYARMKKKSKNTIICIDISSGTDKENRFDIHVKDQRAFVPLREMFVYLNYFFQLK